MVLDLAIEKVIEILTCPISGKIFLDPVVASDGRTYERDEITDYVNEHKCSPETLRLMNNNFYPNNLAKRFIVELLQQHPEYQNKQYIPVTNKIDKNDTDNKSFITYIYGREEILGNFICNNPKQAVSLAFNKINATSQTSDNDKIIIAVQDNVNSQFYYYECYRQKLDAAINIKFDDQHETTFCYRNVIKRIIV